MAEERVFRKISLKNCSCSCSVLFCSVLFCSVLFCSVLFCSVKELFMFMFCSVLFCSVLFCSVLSFKINLRVFYEKGIFFCIGGNCACELYTKSGTCM